MVRHTLLDVDDKMTTYVNPGLTSVTVSTENEVQRLYLLLGVCISLYHVLHVAFVVAISCICECKQQQTTTENRAGKKE